MGRPASWPPKVSIHKASGRARVFYRGEEYPLGRAGSPEAQRAYVALLARLAGEAPAGAKARGPTVAEALAAWLAHAEGRYAGGPEYDEHRRVAAVVLAECGALPAADFTAQALERVRDRMIAHGWCRNVINRRVGRARTAWRWLEQRGHAPPGAWGALRAMAPLSRADRRARSTGPVRPATWAAVCACARQLPPAPRGLLYCLWYTGARPGELFGLTAGQAQAGAARLEKHKNAWRGQERVVVFGPQAMAVLRPLCRGKAPGELVFANRNGRAYNRNSFLLRVKRACVRAGVEPIHPYQCRHSAGTRVAERYGIEAAQLVLGHKSPVTTRGYVAPDERKVIEIMRQVG